MLILENIQAQREKLHAKLAELDRNESEIRAKFGLEPLTTKRSRLKNEAVAHIRSELLKAIRPGHWYSVKDVMDGVAVYLDAYDPEEVKRQLRALEKDTNSPIAHNGEKGRGSRYCLMNEDGTLPAAPVDEERLTAWVLNAFKGFRKDGKLKVKPETVCDKLFEREAFDDMTISDMINFIRNTDGVLAVGEKDTEEERFVYIGK